MNLQKSDKGDSVVIVDRLVYCWQARLHKKMDNILSAQKKFTIVNLKDDTLLNFAVSQEKHVHKVLKKLIKSNSMAEKTRKLSKPVCNTPGVMYGSCKVHKPPFRPILSTLNTPTYKLAKFLVPIVKALTTYKFTVKDSFHFGEEIVDQQSDFFGGSLDVDPLFTNISFEETIEICTNELFKESETVGGLSKSDFKELLFLYLASKDSHFIFMKYTL